MPEVYFGVSALLCGFLGWWIGRTKGRSVLGLVLGLVLGVIGLIIIAVLRGDDRSRR